MGVEDWDSSAQDVLHHVYILETSYYDVCGLRGSFVHVANLLHCLHSRDVNHSTRVLDDSLHFFPVRLYVRRKVKSHPLKSGGEDALV